MATSGESSQPIQSFFERASNITIHGDFLANSYFTGGIGDSQVRVLVQLLQANLSQRGLSQPVGYNRENGVRIIDAFGGELILPPSIVGQYSDVHDLMLKHFRGKLGEERVVESRYCIMTESDGTLVQPEDWDCTLNSGQRLIMCMIVEKIWVKSMKDTCPQCGKTKYGTFPEGGWLICRRCQKRFRSSADSISQVIMPPIHDNKIASFRHIRKVFVEVSWSSLLIEAACSSWIMSREYDDARREEESLFEGEVSTPPQRFHLESRYHSSSDNESNYSSSSSSEDDDP
ncbi:hypothetical protein FA13DRAFT_1732956 [Coprinellus micaceus]|uniref:Ubiquitin-like domain-containing protein n=1 Tax=Coprinellus micaceus TaxID=71717 RepID=A0A4Y7TAH0_COPMI|nr:hypothetical protein FA13DRAFT_1732956 [Coprinellus micaceus]